MTRRRRPRRRLLLAVALVAAAALSFATTQAFTAANTVPATNISQISQAVTAAELTPSECASLGITSVVASSTSTASHQLVLGSGGADAMSDTFGSVCMVGGAGADTFNGKKNGGDLCVVSAASGSVKNCTVVATRP